MTGVSRCKNANDAWDVAYVRTPPDWTWDMQYLVPKRGLILGRGIYIERVARCLASRIIMASISSDESVTIRGVVKFDKCSAKRDYY